mmetsp:Transcript_22423/g.57431  ORF Transcript_22423/g.57431 Transcript_22423/m.57431 type:complete len:215 (-) Transcript_22423:27-671(-)
MKQDAAVPVACTKRMRCLCVSCHLDHPAVRSALVPARLARLWNDAPSSPVVALDWTRTSGGRRERHVCGPARLHEAAGQAVGGEVGFPGLHGRRDARPHLRRGRLHGAQGDARQGGARRRCGARGPGGATHGRAAHVLDLGRRRPGKPRLWRCRAARRAAGHRRHLLAQRLRDVCGDAGLGGAARQPAPGRVRARRFKGQRYRPRASYGMSEAR